MEARISPYTRAILPVHMRGAPCRMDALMDVAGRHGLKVLEDAAQANGASYQGRRVGAWGDAGAFSLQFNKIITSGEGGMLTTSDEQVYLRAVMYHDVVGGMRNHVPEDEILPGINFRMPELLGAVALVQLRRLRGLLEDMRARKRFLKSVLAEIAPHRGVQFRAMNDADGDAAIALVFFLPEAADARQVSRALSAEGLDNFVMYSPDAVDYHVYAHWSPIINQRSWTPGSGPWVNHPRRVEYHREMCPRTLDLLGRAVHVDISPDLSSAQMEEMAAAFYKVLS